MVTAIQAGTGTTVTALTNASGIVYTINTITSQPQVMTPTAVAVPAAVKLGKSPFTFTNLTGVTLECYFDKGSTVRIAKNGVRVFSGTPGYFLLQPSNTATVTYSGAPTFQTNGW